MDQFPNEKLNDLNCSKVSEQVAKSNSSKSVEESVNLESDSKKLLPNKEIFRNPQTQTQQSKHIPFARLTESVIHKNGKKSVSCKNTVPKNFHPVYENDFYNQYLSKNDENLNVNTDETINSPTKDGNSNAGIFPPPSSTSDTLNPETKPFDFVFGGSKVDLEKKKFTFTLKHDDDLNKSMSPTKKHLNEDETLAPILKCINSLNTIILNAAKSKVIGIFDSFERDNTNGIKSALVQLRLSPERASWINKCVFVNNLVPTSDFIIRENIICAHRYDAQRYYSAIALSCLREDLELLADGDKTVISKKGFQLTDAQKEKLALARAFYVNKDIYFLDNILNSIDETTGQRIFKSLIKGALEEKVVIFITHNPVYLSQCDEIYVMKDGEIKAQGEHGLLLQTNEYYASTIKASADNIFNKSVKISIDELSSNEKREAELRVLKKGLKIVIIYITIISLLLYAFHYLTMEQINTSMGQLYKLMEQLYKNI